MKKFKVFLRIFLWVSLPSTLFILMGFIENTIKEEKCSEVIINIEDGMNYGFINEDEIRNLLNKRFNTPISQKIKDIDTYEIEKALNEHQAVEKADVYISIDGKLIIDLSQRKAILRVFSKNKSFYIDNKGKIMPISEKYTAHVPVATGEINLDLPSLLKFTNLKGELIDSVLIPKLYFDLFYLSSFIDSNPFWKAQIEQVYVDKQSEFELIPRVGNHTIVLGGVYNLQQKFDKLMQFYTKGLSKTGWNEYRTINLKYKDQVVCTKRF